MNIHEYPTNIFLKSALKTLQKYQGTKVKWVANAILLPAVLLATILNATFVYICYVMTMMGIQKSNCPLRILVAFNLQIMPEVLHH